ncbi:hypothetical protein C4556_01700 [Candidatus Parcubacteria bacterium]|nr:MAG: hypothetical protein C4556_01700 [Candidatus Parcubacteria bacterium]
MYNHVVQFLQFKLLETEDILMSDTEESASKALEAGPQYIGLNAARAMATSVGWSRSQTISIVQVPLIAAVATIVFAADPPYEVFPLMIAGCTAGVLLNITWFAIIRRAGTWIDFFNKHLADLERVGSGAPVAVFSSPEFLNTASRWGANKTLKAYAWILGSLWLLAIPYLTFRQFPQLF